MATIDSQATSPVGTIPVQALSAADKISPAREDHVPRGIMCMVVATLLFSIAFAISKWVVALYPVGEVMFLRSFSSLIAVAAVMLPMTGFSVFATRRPRDHIARGLSQAI